MSITTPPPQESPFKAGGADRTALSNAITPTPVPFNGITNFRIFNPFRTTHNSRGISIDTSRLLIQAAQRYEQYAANMRDTGPITVTTTNAPSLSDQTIPSPEVNVTTTTLPPGASS